MRALILIDSFKGTITSKELGIITKEELNLRGIEADYYPISDGGDGFLDAISALKKLDAVQIECFDPFFRLIDAYYLFDKEEKTAYIELAKESGINLVNKDELNPYLASTYGLGEAIKDACFKGAKKVIVGIGGSATNDCGSGMLEALGVKFYHQGKLLTRMNNEKLALVDDIDTSFLDDLIKDTNILVMCDVVNPLLGKRGATYVFSPQKGAKDDDLAILEANISNFSEVTKRKLGTDLAASSGSGAAGGVGYALKSYLNAKYIKGIDFLLSELEKKDLCFYDTVISGEGRIDDQSMDGKVISGIVNHFKDKRIILLCAINQANIDYEVHSIVPDVAKTSESMLHPKECFRKLVQKSFNRYNGVIFDLDGTLLNTIDDITDALNYAISELDILPVSTSEAKYLVGSGVDNLIKNMIKLRKIDEEKFDHLKERYLSCYYKCKKNKTKPYEGIIDLLLELKKRSVQIAVFSNKPDNDTVEVIDYYFPNIFDVVVGKRKNVAIKPSGDGAKPIIDSFKLDKKEILYIGDTSVDMATARNIGVDSVGALWGFRTKDELVEAGAKTLANCPMEVLGLFEV